MRVHLTEAQVSLCQVSTQVGIEIYDTRYNFHDGAGPLCAVRLPDAQCIEMHTRNEDTSIRMVHPNFVAAELIRCGCIN